VPRPPRKVPIKRLSLEMPTDVYERVEVLRDRTNSRSMAELIRRSVGLYKNLLDALDEDQRIIIRGKDGTEQRVVLGQI